MSQTELLLRLTCEVLSKKSTKKIRMKLFHFSCEELRDEKGETVEDDEGMRGRKI